MLFLESPGNLIPYVKLFSHEYLPEIGITFLPPRWDFYKGGINYLNY